MSIHEFHSSLHSNRTGDQWLAALRQLNQVDDPTVLSAQDDAAARGWPLWNLEDDNPD